MSFDSDLARIGRFSQPNVRLVSAVNERRDKAVLGVGKFGSGIASKKFASARTAPLGLALGCCSSIQQPAAAAAVAASSSSSSSPP